MNIRNELHHADTHRLVLRFLKLGEDEQRSHIHRYFDAPGVQSSSSDGVTFKIEGVVDSNKNLRLSYSATPDEKAEWVVGLWIFLNNGTDSEAPVLCCSSQVLNGAQSATDYQVSGALLYAALVPLQPVLRATIMARLNTGKQSTVKVEIQTSASA